MQERIQKYMARCGVASRRKAEELVLEGRVKINGQTINSVVSIDPDVDRVEFDGRVIKPEERKVYIMLNKPVGIITSAKDQFDRKTVLDIIKVEERVFPVGRLDFDTAGLIILTNDGDLAYRMTHPSHEVEKVYLAEIAGIPTEDELERFRRGLEIEDYVTAPSKIRVLKEIARSSQVEITIHEGKNRQVRKMCDAIGHPVIRLKRIRIGSLGMEGLEEGKWRELTDMEVEYLKSL